MQSLKDYYYYCLGMILIANYLRVGLQVSKGQSAVNDELTGLERCWNTHYLEILLLHTFSCIIK